MSETIGERIRRYVLDSSDEDLQRLLSIAELSAEPTRTAFRKIGMKPGWRAIDCGCGPLGALAVMAEMVGPEGRVVGIDFSEPAVQRARSIASTLGLDNVEVRVGDVHDLDGQALGSAFDVAYTRLFLVHQRDPAQTLERIAALLRPGGWIIAHEPLRSPPPRSSPPLDALTTYWELLYDMVERLGAPQGSVDALARRARESGLEVVETSGFFQIVSPEQGFDLHASTIAAAKSRAIQSGVGSGAEIDALERALRAAKDGGYDWVTTPFFLALTLRTQPG
jgi:ubiquinone/menaquinone biosynthesis C-methylase UbiE